MFKMIALFALIAVAAAAPSPQVFYAQPFAQPYAAQTYAAQTYAAQPYAAQPLLARYSPAPQAPASTEHATHVAAVSPVVYSTYNYVPAYAPAEYNLRYAYGY